MVAIGIHYPATFKMAIWPVYDTFLAGRDALEKTRPVEGYGCHLKEADLKIHLGVLMATDRLYLATWV